MIRIDWWDWVKVSEISELGRQKLLNQCNCFQWFQETKLVTKAGYWNARVRTTGYSDRRLHALAMLTERGGRINKTNKKNSLIFSDMILTL